MVTSFDRAAFADEYEIPYWISDETLLGWEWGKKRLFWDDSIKIQVPFKILHELLRLNLGQKNAQV